MKVTLKSFKTIKERISHVEWPWRDTMVYLEVHEHLDENDNVFASWIQRSDCEGPSFIYEADHIERKTITNAVEDYYKQQGSIRKEGIEVILNAYKKATRDRDDYDYAGTM